VEGFDMPYTISRNDAGEYCVYKKNEDDNPIGESLGCHDTQDEAAAQIGAIEASENQKTSKRYSQEEVHLQTESKAVDASACDTCRWFDSGVSMCLTVENYPAEITAKSCCDEYTARPEIPQLKPEGPVVVEDHPTVEEPTSDISEPGYAILNPTSNQKGFVQSIKERLTGGLRPGQTMFRDADGRRYMFSVTSNSYMDRDNETIATKALQRYVDNCWVAEDYFKSSNVLQVWHHDGLTVGDIVWADMSGPFLVEISKERGDIISQVAWDYWESEEGCKNLGTSHRFLYRKQDKGADGTVALISKFETSPLPRHEAAANLLTFSGVIPMSKARDEYLDKMFGVEGVAELLKDGPQKLAEALEAAGVQHKSADEPTPDEAVQTAQNNFGTLLMQMIDSAADMAAELDTLKAATEQKALEQNTALEAMETKLKALETDNATLHEAMKQGPRASEAPETEVEPNSEMAAKVKAQLAKPDPFFGGVAEME
jgi:hypothetical protein